MQFFDEKPNVDSRELDYTLEYTLSAINGIMSYWFKQSDSFTNEELYDLIKRLMEQGVMNQLPL